MLRPDWPYMGPIHHIKLSARRQLKFSPVTYFFISNKSSKIFSLFKNASMTSTLYPWWSMVQCSIQELKHLCSFCIHSIQACCPFCKGLFSGWLVTHRGRGLRAFHGLLKHFHSAARVLTNSRIQCKSNAF